jgi:hypothetical protein
MAIVTGLPALIKTAQDTISLNIINHADGKSVRASGLRISVVFGEIMKEKKFKHNINIL